MSFKFIRPAGAIEAYGKKRTAFYSDVAAGLLPPLVKLGPRASAIPEHELDAVLSARAAGKSPDEIRALVSVLVARRAA